MKTAKLGNKEAQGAIYRDGRPIEISAPSWMKNGDENPKRPMNVSIRIVTPINRGI